MQVRQAFAVLVIGLIGCGPVGTNLSSIGLHDLSVTLRFGGSLSPGFPIVVGQEVPLVGIVNYCCEIPEVGVQFLVNGAARESRSFSLAGSGSKTVEFTYRPAKLQKDIVGIVVDPNNKITEASEFNNASSLDVQVAPNLSANLSPAGIQTSPSPAKFGGQLSVSASISHCCNQDDLIEIELIVDGKTVGQRSFTGRPRGDEKVDFDFTPTATGRLDLGIVVDPRQQVWERFESDNLATYSVIVE